VWRRWHSRKWSTHPAAVALQCARHLPDGGRYEALALSVGTGPAAVLRRPVELLPCGERTQWMGCWTEITGGEGKSDTSTRRYSLGPLAPPPEGPLELTPTSSRCVGPSHRHCNHRAQGPRLMAGHRPCSSLPPSSLLVWPYGPRLGSPRHCGYGRGFVASQRVALYIPMHGVHTLALLARG
jgi:hypothetical protein